MRLPKMVTDSIDWFTLLMGELALIPAADADGRKYAPNRKARRRAVALARAAGGPGVSVSPYYLARVEGRRRPDPGHVRARRLEVERLDGRA
jgi:hypothetical protein